MSRYQHGPACWYQQLGHTGISFSRAGFGFVGPDSVRALGSRHPTWTGSVKSSWYLTSSPISMRLRQRGHTPRYRGLNGALRSASARPWPRTLGASRRSLLAAFKRARSDLDSLVIGDLPGAEFSSCPSRSLVGQPAAGLRAVRRYPLEVFACQHASGGDGRNSERASARPGTLDSAWRHGGGSDWPTRWEGRSANWPEMPEPWRVSVTILIASMRLQVHESTGETPGLELILEWI